jgi:hypothetical protein
MPGGAETQPTDDAELPEDLLLVRNPQREQAAAREPLCRGLEQQGHISGADIPEPGAGDDGALRGG